MENKSQVITLVGEQSVICRNLAKSIATTATASTSPTVTRLTPTGKISYAKTRVYTQRYRKQWEQMSDFKGWLTSVPYQPTRAYCLYCKKNLHAHRLSLLKHTCTMKHQRSALAYVLEDKYVSKSDTDTPEVGLMEEEVETLDDSTQTELDEDNEDDIEYVIERLETDEDETMEFKDVTEKVEETRKLIKHEEEKELIVIDNSQSKDEESVIKKIKLSPKQKYRDPLAEVMAHVHSEYLEEEVRDQEDVQIEMVIESTNDNVSVLSESMDDDVEKISKPSENEKPVIKATKNGKVHQEENKDNLIVTSSIPILNTTYQANPTNTIPIQNSFNLMPLTTTNMKTQKTITLMCGNKAFTLTGGTFQPGTQYVLTKLKGKPLMLTDQNKVTATNESNKIKEEPPVPGNQSPTVPTVPSTSQQPTVIDQQSTDTKSKKATVSGKQPIIKQTASKKLRISTYVVDTIKGIPIGGLQVSLYKLMDGKWTFLNENNTNAEGHCSDLVEKVNGTIGRYKIHFDVDKYFTLKRIDTMFPFVEIVFDVKNPNVHYHIPLLLSPFGYTTYRGT